MAEILMGLLNSTQLNGWRATDKVVDPSQGSSKRPQEVLVVVAPGAVLVVEPGTVAFPSYSLVSTIT